MEASLSLPYEQAGTMSHLKNKWFYYGMALVFILALRSPALAETVQTYRVVDIGIFMAFLLTGLTLETGRLFEQIRQVRTLLAAAASSLLIMPLATYGLACLFFYSRPDYRVGAVIIAAAPVTVVSGTVMTALARGNVALSLLICVTGNVLSLLTIPLLLPWLLPLHETVALPVANLFGRLALIVLLPTLTGQLLRIKLKDRVDSATSAMSVFSRLVVLLIIYNAAASSADPMRESGWEIAGMLIFVIGLHIFFLLMNYCWARALRLDRPSRSAFTIHTSQKTLTVSYVVWAGYFAVDYPMAMLPGIAYHLTQMLVDGWAAGVFRHKTELSEM